MAVIIQNRRGNYSAFDPSRLKPGEFAIVQSGDLTTDTGMAVYIAISAGNILRIVTQEELAGYESRLEALTQRVENLLDSIQESVRKIEDLEDVEGQIATAVNDYLTAHPEIATDIPDNGVTVLKIADGAVTEPKLATGAVSTNKIQDNAVTAAKLADGALSGEKLTTKSVATDKLADGAVTEAKIASGAVTVDKLASGVLADNLTTANAGVAALDARQGRLLNENKVDKTSIADDLTTNDATKVLSAKQGKILQDNKVDMTTPLINLDVNAAASTVDGQLTAALTALWWLNDVIES